MVSMTAILMLLAPIQLVPFLADARLGFPEMAFVALILTSVAFARTTAT